MGLLLLRYLVADVAARELSSLIYRVGIVDVWVCIIQSVVEKTSHL